ncbi:hypothetical protein GCM10009839_48800 [Catenulispora yoronensis]|uniref:Secreted protein n=1 Tax=Catenulispora yoronensis TaxID=450799 RepID=A0ABN2URC6_9ACTN
MRPTPARRLAFAATLALGLGAAVAPAATAGPIQDPIPIQPNTYFYGLVNGKAADAVIQVICPGPISPTSTGHPLEGQTAEVRSIVPPVSSLPGYTGSGAHQIDAGLSLPSSTVANAPIVFTSFFAPAKIPTTWAVPCGGTSTMTFVPLATSTTARSYSVTVSFVNIAV